MDRREALAAVSFLLGGTIIGAEAFLSGCSTPESREPGLILSGDQMSLLDQVGETILPTTPTSQGAGSTAIGQFMDVIVKDCYSETEQKIFLDGISKLTKASKDAYSKDFAELQAEEKHALLLKLDQEAAGYRNTRKPEDPDTHYFTMLKQLTVWGYLTSQEGFTKALDYVPVPGRYEACIDLKPGQKAWANP